MQVVDIQEHKRKLFQDRIRVIKIMFAPQQDEEMTNEDVQVFVIIEIHIWKDIFCIHSICSNFKTAKEIVTDHIYKFVDPVEKPELADALKAKACWQHGDHLSLIYARELNHKSQGLLGRHEERTTGATASENAENSSERVRPNGITGRRNPFNRD